MRLRTTSLEAVTFLRESLSKTFSPIPVILSSLKDLAKSEAAVSFISAIVIESIPSIELTAEEANLHMPPLPPKIKTFINKY